MRNKLIRRRDVKQSRSPRRKGYVPGIMEYERRQLLATGFLQGTVYNDFNNDSKVDAGEAVAGAEVQLFDVTGTTSYGVRTTNNDGYYLFDNLTPGDYKLVQQPGGGYVGQSAQAVSPTINPILAGGSGAAINVRVTDPSSFTSVTYNSADQFAGPYEVVNYQVDGVTYLGAIGPLPINLTGSALTTPKFSSYCLDATQSLLDGPNTFDVEASEMPPEVNDTGNATRIAYLYNRYGTANSITSIEGGALQLAIWELEYDTTPDFTDGRFKGVQASLDYPVTTPQADVNSMVARALQMIAESSGKDARALLLEAPGADPGRQSMIASSNINFTSVPGHPGIDIVKLTNGTDNNSPTGPVVPVGSTVTWTYVVTNTGDIPLSNLIVTDDRGVVPVYQEGDTDNDNLLDLTETWTYTATGLASAGQYVNNGTVTGKDATDTTVTDSDVDHYFGELPKGTIRGKKYNDLTGNGLTAYDTPLGGVKIYIDKDNSNTLNAGDISTTTAADGTYSFIGLAPGSYTVREVVPTGWIRTGPALTDEYVVNVTAGSTSSGNDFANAEIGCECQISNIVYIINGCRQVTDLRGNVDPGDTVTAKFTVKNTSASNPATFSLVSYTAPGATFVASEAYKQEVFDMVTMTYTSNGSYSLKVDVPDSYFQVDFVCGQVIDRFGPAGSNIFYTPQGRLFSADNGGSKVYSNSVSADDIGTVNFWCGSSGQNLIKSLNGGSTSKGLGNWLSSNFSNLYGSLAGKSNSEVAAYFKALKDSSSTALEAQVMATALSIYVTDVDLAGMAAYSYGFHNSFLGIAMKTFNVGSNGSVLGLTNNTKQSLWVILKAADSYSSNGVLQVSYRSKASTLFTSLNAAGALDG